MRNTSTCIFPGQTLGILGAGQLARMTALAAQRMGYKVVVYAPERDAPATSVCHQHIVGAYEDAALLNRFARTVDVVTLEFENIPSTALAFLADHVPVRPAQSILSTTQNRIQEKNFLQQNGFPVTPFSPVNKVSDLETAIETVGVPAILKTAASGYDGKGQHRVHSLAEAQEAFTGLGQVACVLEMLIPLEKEISVVVARSPQGETRCFPVFENTHQNHILHTTLVPSLLSPELQQEAADIAMRLAEILKLEGLLCVEFFVTSFNGNRPLALMVNELAPRPHNSGHVSIEACYTSQFEQFVRAVCNLPLGNPALKVPAAGMLNLLGNYWKQQDGFSRFSGAEACFKMPKAALHLYGKTEARPGRKMGHLTLTGLHTQEVEQQLNSLYQEL